MKSLLNQSQHTCDFTINNQRYPEGEIERQHIQGASGCRLSPYVISPHPPRPIHTKTRPQHRELRPLEGGEGGVPLKKFLSLTTAWDITEVKLCVRICSETPWLYLLSTRISTKVVPTANLGMILWWQNVEMRFGGIPCLAYKTLLRYADVCMEIFSCSCVTSRDWGSWKQKQKFRTTPSEITLLLRFHVRLIFVCLNPKKRISMSHSELSGSTNTPKWRHERVTQEWLCSVF